MASDFILKVLTLGETTVGKTSIILRYTENVFHTDQISTIGIDFKNKIVTYKGKKIKLLIYDTAGQERFKTMASQYYKGADGVLIIYDITNHDSFEKTKVWVQQLKEKADLFSLVLYLIGNKSDRPNREVTYEEGEKYAKENQMKFTETSALNNSDKNINDLFDKLVADLYEKSKEKFDESIDEIPQNVKMLNSLEKQKKLGKKGGNSNGNDGCCK